VTRVHATVAASIVALALLNPLAAGAAAAESSSPVGMQDLAGEACTATPRTDIAPDPNAAAPVYIACGAVSRPNGSVSAVIMPLSLPADIAARHAAIERAAADAPAGRDAAARLVCRPGPWTKTVDGIDLLVRSCATTDGDWPQVHVIAGLGRFLVQADGLPSLLPALEAEMATLADYHAPQGKLAFGGTEEARRDLEAAFGNKLKITAGGDFNRYGDLVEQARLYGSRMNYPAAEAAYREALDIQERAFGPDTIGVATTLLNLGLTVSNQGRFEEADGLFRRADPIVQASDNPIYRARNFEYLGYDAANRGKFADALRYARGAVAMWRDLSAAQTSDVEQLTAGNQAHEALRGELANGLNLAAAMAWRVGDLAYAEAAAKEALDIISNEPNLPPWWGPDVLMTLGDILAREGRLREAEESLRGALIFKERLFGNSAPTAMALLAVGRVYAADGLDDEALRAFDFALDIMAKDDVARSLLVYDKLAPLVTVDDRLGKQHPDRRAKIDDTLFRALQYMAASVTDQTIARASARLAAHDPANEKLVRELQDAERKRDTARISLGYESSLPQEQRGAEREQALLKDVDSQEARRQALEAQIRARFPGYFRLAAPEPVALPALQKRLRPGEAVVEFEFGRDHAAVVLVTAHGFSAQPIQSDQTQIAASVRAIRRTLDARGGRIGEFDLADAYRLYRTLFGPIEGQLAGIDRLIVVPGDALASLPIGLLVTQPPSGARDYGNAAWLVRRVADSVVPSVRAFVTLRDKVASKGATRPFLGVGNPDFQGATGARRGARSGLEALATHCGDNGPIPAAMLRALAPLPETAAEVRQVAQTLGAGPDALLLGANATEAAFRREPLDQFRVLYFATHGLLPGELSCQTQPALALSPPPVPATSKSEDGLLDAGEIAGLRLNADLVVLSACNTAEGGTKFGGEALSGVAQAFFFAGARTLVASHWEVPSVPTVALMVGMFQRLGSGGGTAEALRQSQLALIAQPRTADPFFWAAFTVLGDGDSAAPAEAPKSRQSALSPREVPQ
jgi:CHAT domain-containing protein